MLNLHHKQYGSHGSPLIILHGFLGSLDNWHTLAQAFANAGFMVFAIDLRNHGKSPHTHEHSLELMADDVYHFMQQHQLKECSIIGHSMGGKVAMQLAIHHPETIHKLVIADIAPRAYSHGAHDAVFEAIFSINPEKIQSRNEAESLMSAHLGDFGTRQFILKNLERTENGFRWKFNIQTLHREYHQAIQAVNSRHPVQIPALFIRGGQSLYIRETDFAEILNLFPKARFETIEHAGHWIHADQPKQFYESVVSFLNDAAV